MNISTPTLKREPASQAMRCILEYEKIPLTERFPTDTTYALIQQAGKNHKDKPALRQLYTAQKDEETTPITAKQFADLTTQTANLLNGLGLRQKDAVTILLPSLMENQIMLWGSQAAGIANPVNHFLETEHIVEIMNAVKSRVLITLAPGDSLGLEHKIKDIIAQVPTLNHLLLTQEHPNHSIDAAAFKTDTISVMPFMQSLTNYPKDHLESDHCIKGTDTAIFFHTGGTTGKPKIAKLCHSSVAFVAQVYADFNQPHGNSPALNPLPLFHVFGTIAASLSIFILGRCVIHMTSTGFRNPSVVKNWWYFVEKYNVSWFATVPTILNALLHMPVKDNDISCLNFINSGSALLPVPLKIASAEKFKAEVVSGYGMTESSCLISRCLPGFEHPDDTVGLRIPYTDLIVAEISKKKINRICKPGEAGTVLAKGPHIFEGYLNPEENKKAWIEDEWLDTGDIGVFDKDGYLRLTGRAKDLIIRGGHNIDPQIIEKPLERHPDISQVAAIGQPDAYAGELPVAYATLKPGALATVKELEAYCQKEIPERSAIPKRIEVLDDMPLTAVGKISRPELRNRATEFAVSRALSDKKIDARLEAFQSPEKGQQVRIRIESKADKEKIQQMLIGFPIVAEIECADI